MAYRTILVHVDDTRHAQQCIDVAARIAQTENAHLIGASSSGIRMPFYPTGIPDPYLPAMSASFELVQERIKCALSLFEAAMERIGVPSFETRLIDGESGEAVSMLARHCDLVVLGQADPDDPAPLVPPDFPEYVIMHCGRPVLVVPFAGKFDTIAQRPLVAWDASTSAARAVADALPFLRRAGQLEQIMFNPEKLGATHGRQSETDIALYMTRHGIKVNATHRSADGPVGPALLRMATELGSDLIVMGAYGHRRFREILLGGVTRSILNSMTVAALMSH
ncbi:MAG: universal stress protein [Pseudomonadota bacterium]